MNELLQLYFPRLGAWAILLIVLAGTLLIGSLIAWLLFRALRLYGKRFDKTALYNVAIKDLERPFTYFTILLLMINTVIAVPIYDTGALFPLTSGTIDRIQVFLRICIYIVAAWGGMRIVYIFIQIIKSKNNIDETLDNLEQRKIVTQLDFIQKLSSVIIVLVAFSLVLLEFEEVRKIGAGLLTSAGVAGIIIGFAAQKSIANLLAGLQIAFTQPIRIDDVIIIEGEFGRVEEISLTYVVVRIWDQRRMIVPLNHFIDKPFQNWTRSNSELLGSVFIYSDYTLPIEPIRQELYRLTDDHPLWDGRVRNVLLIDVTESSMKIRLLVSAKSAGDAFDLRCFIREKIITFIQENYPTSLPKARVEIKPSVFQELVVSQVDSVG